MPSRAIVAVLFIFGALAPGTFATTDDEGAPQRQWAIVKFEHPTKVSTKILMGPYLIVHDEAKMARGEPCTSFYRVETQMGRHEETVSFHCIPHERHVAERFTIAEDWDDALGMYALTEYQFARDAEGHGVPIAALASDHLRIRALASGVRPIRRTQPHECMRVTPADDRPIASELDGPAG